MSFFKRFIRPRAKLWLEPEKSSLSLGEELKGIVGIKSEEKFNVQDIVLSLQCWERVKKTGGYEDVGFFRSDRMMDQLEWHEGEYTYGKILYSERLLISGQMHVRKGLEKEFPFVITIPANGKETSHSVDRKVVWEISTFMNIKGRRQVETQELEVLVTSLQHS